MFVILESFLLYLSIVQFLATSSSQAIVRREESRLSIIYYIIQIAITQKSRRL